MRRITKINPKYGDTYDILVDISGIEYYLDGTPIKIPPINLSKDILVKKINEGLLKKIIYGNPEEGDIYEIYIDKDNNKYTLDGIGII